MCTQLSSTQLSCLHLSHVSGAVHAAGSYPAQQHSDRQRPKVRQRPAGLVGQILHAMLPAQLSVHARLSIPKC